MHKYGIDNAIQSHLDVALAIPGLLAALVCLGPKRRSGEYVCRAPEATEEVVNALDEVAHHFQSQGKAGNLERVVPRTGAVLVSTYNGSANIAPYLVAAIRQPEVIDVDSLRKKLSAILYACVGESYSIKWK
jgi:hypothetical protein